MFENAMESALEYFGEWLGVMFAYGIIYVPLSFRIEDKGRYHDTKDKVISYLLGILVALVFSIITAIMIKSITSALTVLIITTVASFWAVTNLYAKEEGK